MITARLLGPPELTIHGAPPPPELLWRKHFALLVYLHCAPRPVVSRAHLLDLLWGEKPEAAARHSLNEALRVLRRTLGDDAVEGTGDQVRLAAPMESDLRQVAAALRSGDVARAAEFCGGEFLEGFEVPGATPFGDWVAAMRAEWGRRAADTLAGAAEVALEGGDASRAAVLAHRAAGLDPQSPRAVEVAMRSLALAGDRAGALGHHDRFTGFLREAGMAAPASLARLAERIRSRPAAPSRPGMPPPDPSRRAPLVGRDGQLRGLLGVWQEVQGGAARLGMIVGDSGTGLTRLLEEVTDRCRLDGAATVVLRSVPADREEPGGGLRALAGGALIHAPGVGAAPAAALATMAEAHPAWADRYPAARQATAAPLRKAVTDILRAAAGESPIVLAIDNAHWLDTDSLTAAIGLLRDLAPHPFYLLLAWSSQPPRPELLEAAARLGRDHHGVQVSLGPLPLPDLEQLAAWAQPGYSSEAASRLARRIAVDSAGLPLLAVELLHAVAGGLDLEAQAEPWPAPARTLDQTRPGSLPDSVVAAIRLGFRRLSPGARQLLMAASVLEERVAAPRLGAAAGLDGNALAEGLDELEWHRWMSAEARGYSFVARVAREVVARDLVTPGQRRRFQEAAAGS